MDPITMRGTTAQLVVRPHRRRTAWLYALASRPRARRLLHALGLKYVPARDEPIETPHFKAGGFIGCNDVEAMRLAGCIGLAGPYSVERSR